MWHAFQIVSLHFQTYRILAFSVTPPTVIDGTWHICLGRKLSMRLVVGLVKHLMRWWCKNVMLPHCSVIICSGPGDWLKLFAGLNADLLHYPPKHIRNKCPFNPFFILQLRSVHFKFHLYPCFLITVLVLWGMKGDNNNLIWICCQTWHLKCF